MNKLQALLDRISGKAQQALIIHDVERDEIHWVRRVNIPAVLERIEMCGAELHSLPLARSVRSVGGKVHDCFVATITDRHQISPRADTTVPVVINGEKQRPADLPFAERDQLALVMAMVDAALDLSTESSA